MKGEPLTEPGLGTSLAETAAWLLFVWGAGWFAARSLFPADRVFRFERLGWGFAVGAAALAAIRAGCLAAGSLPGRPAVVAGIAAVAVALHFLPAAGMSRGGASRAASAARRPPATVLLLAAVLVGVLLYALRALTEPMWSNDFLAIWGLKGKALASSASFPAWLRDPALAGFSHPEYPSGLPLLFAGLSALRGRWDDHGMALLYPAIQVATLLVLAGWLRRRGASHAVALTAAALLALFEPLYSAFLTGMAEVPLSAAVLLLGTALFDALDDTDTGAVRRLAAASLFAASIKNEGIFIASVASIAALGTAMKSRDGKRRGMTAFGAALVPAAVVAVLTRVASRGAPMRDFDLRLLGSGPAGNLAARIAETLRADIDVAARGWPVLLCIAVLIGAAVAAVAAAPPGPGRAAPRRMLWIAAAALAVYLLVPALSVRGPRWLVETTLPRTAAALAPLAAAGIAAAWGQSRV